MISNTNLFLKNLQALEKRYPHIEWTHVLSPFQDRNPEGIEIRESRSGDLTLLSQQQAVHSLYNPKVEAQKIIQSLSNTKNPKESYIILGFGLGYLVSELLQNHSHKPIIIVEPELHLFALALALRDLYNILLCPFVHLCHTQNEDNLIALLSKLHLHTGHILPNRALAQRLPKIYESLQKTIQFTFMCKNVNRKTLQEQGKLWVRNLCMNLECFVEIPGIHHLTKVFQGIPALLIAAGPSLDTLWEHIKELYDRCVFICVDTALRSLLMHGIEPDFVVSIDSQYWNSRHFDYCQTSRSILVANPSLYPSIFRRKKVFSFFLSSSLFPLGQYIENHLEIKGKLQSGGSVTTSAFDLCRQMGVNSIWIIGLDLGYPTLRTHVHGSQFEHHAFIEQTRLSSAEDVFTRQIYATSLSLYRPGNYVPQVRTDRRMEVYRLWFENQAQTYNCFNLSLGVKIENIPQAKYNDLRQFSKNRTEINNICHHLRQIKTEKSTLSSKLQTLRNKLRCDLQKIIISCQQAQIETHRLLHSINNQNNINISLDKLAHIDICLQKNRSIEFVSFLIEPFLHNAHLNQNAETDPVKKLKINGTLYQKIAENAKFYTKILRL